MLNVTEQFSASLLHWFQTHGRKNLPWQHPRTAYRVWIAEIMLQQTQVQTVIPYFERFIARFPSIEILSKASDDEVLSQWSGLGYYSRARNIHRTAKIIVEQYQGDFPKELNDLLSFPGIGPSTAAAIASQAFNQATAILDGNVIRVLSRHFMVEGWHGISQVKKKLWELANACMSPDHCADYTQAIMDLGATCCTKKPQCSQCPVQTTCQAYLNQVTANYPFKKIKRPIPTKKQQFLLLHDELDRIYLEKRPSKGLWGGLWCLPVVEENKDPVDYIEKNYQLVCLHQRLLTTIKHSFSHFHLHIEAISLAVTSANNTSIPAKDWFCEADLPKLGLAKPISHILEHFFRR